MISPLASPFRGGFRNLTPMRGRGRGSGQFVPQQLGLLAYYDVHNGGSTTQVTDSSGNGLDAFAFAATTAAPTYLAYDGTPYVWLPGSTTNFLSAPDAAGLDVTGDLALAGYIGATDWTPAAAQYLISKYTAAAGRSYGFGINTAGTLRFIAAQNGTLLNIDQSSSAATGATDGAGLWVAISRVSATGTSQFFTASGQPDTVPSSWTQLGTDRTGTAGALHAGTATLRIGDLDTGGNLAGKVYRARVIDGTLAAGTAVADFAAADCAQTGYTDPQGNVWTVNRSAAGRKSVVLGTQGGAAKSVVLFGTDDYGTAPAAAIPAMGASDAWSVILVVRQWDTPTNFGRYLSTKISAGLGKGIAIRTNGTTRQIACHFGDGTNTVDVFGPAAAASGVKQVIVVSCSGGSATIYVNGAAGSATDVSSVGDRATGQMEIGRDAGSAINFQDFELIAAGTVARALTAGDAANLSTYFGGGA